MNLNRVHTLVGSRGIFNVDLSQIYSVVFVEDDISTGFLGLSSSKFYQINILFKTQDQMWIKFGKNHKTAQQEYASLFTAWTEYLEWHS